MSSGTYWGHINTNFKMLGQKEICLFYKPHCLTFSLTFSLHHAILSTIPVYRSYLSSSGILPNALHPASPSLRHCLGITILMNTGDSLCQDIRGLIATFRIVELNKFLPIFCFVRIV